MELRNTLETLLAGKFICQVSNSKLYQQLQDEATRSKVNETLAELGRHLCHTEHYEVYYCTYSDLSQVQDAKRVRNQFETIRDQIAPVLSFITLQMRAEGRDAVLISGDTVKFHDLLSSIEQEQAHLNDLKQLGRYELFKKIRSKTASQERLITVLETLEKEGYIVLTNNESSIYQVSGKIEYFYSCLDFIRDHEQIPLEEEDEVQRGLELDN